MAAQQEKRKRPQTSGREPGSAVRQQPAEKRSEQAAGQARRAATGKMDRRLWLLLFLTLLALVLFLILVFTIPSGHTANAPAHNYDPLSRRDLSAAVASRITPFGRDLLLAQADRVCLQSYEGEDLYIYDGSMTQPQALAFAQGAVVGDRQGHDLLLLSQDGLLFKASLDGSFAGADLSPNAKYLTVIDEVPDQKARIHLLQTDGNKLLTLGFAASGYPLQVRFLPNSRAFDVLILDASSSRLKTLVKRYDISGSLLAQKVIEDYNELFYGLLHDAQGNPVVYSAKTVLKFAFDQEQPLMQASFSQILGVFPIDEQLLIYANTATGGSYSIFSLDKDGSLQEALPNAGHAEHFVQAGSLLLYSEGNTLRSCDLRSHRQGQALSTDGGILRFCLTGDQHISVLTDLGARLYDLP